MKVQDRRDRLVEQFQQMIQYEETMDHLESVIYEMINSNDSVLSILQKESILEIRDQVRFGEMKTTSWRELRNRLDDEYGY